MSNQFKLVNKGISTPIGIFVILVFAFLAGGVTAWQYFETQKEIIKAPEEIDETANWNIYRNEEYGFEFRYPEELGQKYIKAHTWPPKVAVGPINPNFVCEENASQEKILFNNSNYCVLTTNEGAAGTTYVTYRYITDKDNDRLTLEFVLRFPNCGAFYGIDNKMEECEKNEKDFNPTALIDKILSTFQFLK